MSAADGRASGAGPALGGTVLAEAVGRLLGRPATPPLSWSARSIGRPNALHAVTESVYRVAGCVGVEGATQPFSLVVKVLRSPCDAPDAREARAPSHWNYWRREPHVYASGILDALPPGLRAPRSLAVEEPDPDTLRLWLEDVPDAAECNWTLERFALTARHLGRFNGEGLCGRPLPDAPWLSRSVAVQWLARFRRESPGFFAAADDAGVWRHPVVARLFGASPGNPFRRFLADAERFAALLDALPQALCHRDADPDNLRLGRGADGAPETSALDWALAGIGPVGEDLAALASAAFLKVGDAEREPVQEALLHGYREGLAEAGWRGDDRLFRLGFSAAAALRLGLLSLPFLERRLAGGEGDLPADRLFARAAAFVSRTAADAWLLADALGARP